MWQKENRINIQELNSKVCAFGFILYQKRFYKIVYYGIRLLWINCNKVYTCTKTCTKALFAVSKQWSPKKNNTPGICLLKHLFYCSEKKNIQDYMCHSLNIMFITALGWTGQRKFINIITAQHKYFSLSTKLATYVKAILWIHKNSLLAPVMCTSCKILHIYHIRASFKSFHGCWCIHARHEKEKDG